VGFLSSLFGEKNPIDSISLDDLQVTEIQLNKKVEDIHAEVRRIDKEVQRNYDMARSSASASEEVSYARHIKTLLLKKEAKLSTQAQLEKELRAVSNIVILKQREKDLPAGVLKKIKSINPEIMEHYLLSMNLGKIRGMDIRVQLYTVPGQVHYDATRKLVLKGVDGVVFVADSLKVQRKKNIESLINLAKNLAEKGISIRAIPLVIQYNKRDLDGSDSEILPLEILEKDLNSMLKVPSFSASATKGQGIFETLREISKLVVKDVSRKIMFMDKQQARG
jgi:signal recognition particle receptor subunit beta